MGGSNGTFWGWKYHHRMGKSRGSWPAVSTRASRSIGPLLSCGLLLCFLTTAGCGNGNNKSGAESVKYDQGSGASWRIGVGGTRNGNTDSCLADPSIAESIQTADLPSSVLSVVLMTEATEADALRVAECLQAALPDNQVTISRPA